MPRARICKDGCFCQASRAELGSVWAPLLLHPFPCTPLSQKILPTRTSGTQSLLLATAAVLSAVSQRCTGTVHQQWLSTVLATTSSSTSCAPDTVSHALHISTHLIFKITVWGRGFSCPYSQMGKLRHRAFKQFARGSHHQWRGTARSQPRLCSPKVMITILVCSSIVLLYYEQKLGT